MVLLIVLHVPLVNINQHQERQNDCDENPAFHLVNFHGRGTGSKPWLPSGWQRARRRAPSHIPLTAPWM